MSTHNICFRGEIRKILCGYPLLSVAMVYLMAAEICGKVLQILHKFFKNNDYRSISLYY